MGPSPGRALVLAPQTGVFGRQIRTGRWDRRLRIERRGDPAFPRSPASRQERSIEAAIPSSRAIWLNGRPLLASNPTYSRLNSSVN